MLNKVAAILADPRCRVVTYCTNGVWTFGVRYSDGDVEMTITPTDQRYRATKDEAGYAGLAWIDAAKAMLGIETTNNEERR